MINKQKTKISKAKIRKTLKENYLNKFIIKTNKQTGFVVNIIYVYKINNNKIIYNIYEYNNEKLDYIDISSWQLINENTLVLFQIHCQEDSEIKCHII